MAAGESESTSHRAVGASMVEGIDFVRCRICGDHRRVISGRHPSKHDTDRETYVEEYHLTPDELIRGDEQQRGTIHGKPFSAISVYPAFFVAFYSTTLLTSYLDTPDWASVAF